MLCTARPVIHAMQKAMPARRCSVTPYRLRWGCFPTSTLWGPSPSLIPWHHSTKIHSDLLRTSTHKTSTTLLCRIRSLIIQSSRQAREVQRPAVADPAQCLSRSRGAPGVSRSAIDLCNRFVSRHRRRCCRHQRLVLCRVVVVILPIVCAAPWRGETIVVAPSRSLHYRRDATSSLGTVQRLPCSVCRLL